MAFWATFAARRWVLLTATCQTSAFPVQGSFTLQIFPSTLSLDRRIHELQAHVEGVEEYDSEQVVVKVFLEQLFCSVLVAVPMARLEFSERRRLLSLRKRVWVVRSFTRLPPGAFFLILLLSFCVLTMNDVILCSRLPWY